MKIGVVIITLLIGFSSIAQINQTDAKGRKQGTWAKTYPKSTVLMYQGEFKDDKPVGTFTYFYPNKKVKAVMKHELNGRTEAFMYHENGQILSHGIYRNEKKDSIWLNFGPSGRLSNKETYKLDSLHGKKTVYFVPEDPEDYTQRVASEYNYEMGQVEGKFIEYYDNGLVRRTGQFLNHRREGEWITNDANGKRIMLERFKNGQKHGWFIGYVNGIEANKMYYRYGVLYEGDKLKELMQQLKAKGINPND